jgi:hypothetical protein
MKKPAPKMNKLKNSNVKSAKMTTWNVGVPPKLIKITLSRVWFNTPTLDRVKKLAKISNPP